MMAAAGAIIASAAAGALAPDAGAKKRKKAPVIQSVAPKNVSIGETLTIRGKNFVRGREKNTVVFKRDNSKAVFVKAEVGTRKLLRVTVPDRLTDQLLVLDGTQIATPFRLRVLARKLSKKFTTGSLVPLIGPEQPPAPETPVEGQPDGDCDLDKVLNKNDADDDNDLLPDATEIALKTDPCKSDSDEDGVTDGYEFQSSVDLNDDEYQEPQSILPAPVKKPYPNALFADANTDYDGDSLTLGQEFALWKAYRNPAAGLNDLVYSDGNQYSAYGRDGSGRRPGGLVGADPNQKPADFLGWAAAAGYGSVVLRGVGTQLRDMNRDGALRAAPGTVDLDANGTPDEYYYYSEERYFDFDFDGKLSDDERDEDADGLTNYDEASGRMTAGYWKGCYDKEKPFPIEYAGTDLVDPDSDGDGVRDGADDQDHDDIPNVMELSRNAASGRGFGASCDEKTAPTSATPLKGVVNPYNPCIPYTDSRTCERHPSLSSPYFPFDTSAPFYQVLN
ncbi:MAG TPA: IPT/TIG domain-containing protein [Solirubrobacteraceae bacterium]|nr:IPT/TIG domain-containing protein [Solirubrobacteraceae bacterium]